MNKNTKLDNKGFSLVELIIVIAIMAILVGVVGTQVIPYIEKSRQSKDLQIISGFCTSMTSASANCAATMDASATYTINIHGSGSAWTASLDSSCSGLPGASDLLANFSELNGDSTGGGSLSFSFESKEGKLITDVICIYNPASGVTVTPYKTGNVQSNKISAVSSK